jgi:hypothetical protein
MVFRMTARKVRGGISVLALLGSISVLAPAAAASAATVNSPGRGGTTATRIFTAPGRGGNTTGVPPR